MSLHHRLDGDEDGPLLVLAGSLGSTLAMWEPQVSALASRFRVLRFDYPGHGGSPLERLDGIAGLARSVLELVASLGVERFSFCGLSLGGAVGLELATAHAERVQRLVLCCTSARFLTPGAWDERAATVRENGVEAIADAVVGRWFTPAFGDVRRYRDMLVSTDREGYARCCEALRDWDARPRLGAVACPTLVIAGKDDPTSPTEHGEILAGGIRGARLHVVGHAAHLASVERADEVNRLLLEFLS